MHTLLLICASSAAFVRHHLPLAAEAARRMDVHAALTLDRPEDAHAVAAHGITVHPLDLSRKSANPLRILGEAQALRKLMRRLRPDLVNPINLKSVLVAAMARGRLPCRLVGTVTGLGYMFSGNSAKQRVLRRLTLSGLARSLHRGGGRHVLVFSNDDDKREFLRRKVTDAARARIVPVPGVDTDEFRPTPEPGAGFRVVLPSRMLWDKGVGEFAKAARIVRGSVPEAEFLLAGDADPGNPADVGKEQLLAWQREGRLAWLGQCDDMPGLIASCHIVCLPTAYREGFPRVLAEAMACGRAVVTTDMPGCREAVAQARGGLCVPPRDATALAEAILRLYRDPGERTVMAARGRQWVERELSVGVITRRMLDIYGELLDTQG